MLPPFENSEAKIQVVGKVVSLYFTAMSEAEFTYFSVRSVNSIHLKMRGRIAESCDLEQRLGRGFPGGRRKAIHTTLRVMKHCSKQGYRCRKVENASYLWSAGTNSPRRRGEFQGLDKPFTLASKFFHTQKELCGPLSHVYHHK